MAYYSKMKGFEQTDVILFRLFTSEAQRPPLFVCVYVSTRASHVRFVSVYLYRRKHGCVQTESSSCGKCPVFGPGPLFSLNATFMYDAWGRGAKGYLFKLPFFKHRCRLAIISKTKTKRVNIHYKQI